jgi:hypothetical protein
LFNKISVYFLGSLFGDSHSRRQVPPVTTAGPTLNHPTPTQQSSQQQQQTNTASVNTTNSLLARAFGIIIRQVTDLLIRWPATLSASSLYHDVLTTTDEQSPIDTIQVNNAKLLKRKLIFFDLE